MAYLQGYGSPAVLMASRPSEAPPVNMGVPPVLDQTTSQVIDGTPVRTALLLLVAGAGLAALRLSGIRFNVGVSG